MEHASAAGTRTVERALSILDCFTTAKNNYTLQELSDACGLSPATTLRIVRTLEKAGYLYRNEETLHYYLGMKLARLSNVAFENIDFIVVAKPIMARYAQSLHCASNLCVVRGTRRVVVACLDDLRIYRAVIQIGDLEPLTRGAIGKILLCHLPDERIRDILLLDPAVTMAELEQIRKQGYCFSRNENGYGSNGAAAPVYNARGQVIASVNLSNLATLLPPELEEEYIIQTVKMAAEISEELGYVPPED